MKTLTIVTRKQANDILLNSLFEHGATYSEMKYCTGKYKSTPTQMIKEGKQVHEVEDNVHAIFGIRKSDIHGGYTQLMCIVGL